MNASQRRAETLTGSLRPPDECPFARPFPDGFSDCPTFGPQPFVPMDMSDRPLGPVVTCRHLVSRTLGNGKVGWYAGCRLGDSAARQRLAEAAVGSVRQPGPLLPHSRTGN